MKAANILNRLYAAHLRKPEVHESDIGQVALIKRNGFFAAAGLCDRHHSGTAIDDRRDANAHQRVIVNNENFYFFSTEHRVCCGLDCHRSTDHSTPQDAAPDSPAISLLQLCLRL